MFDHRDYCIINLYDIDYVAIFGGENKKITILYQNGEILNIESSKGIDVFRIYRDIIRDLNNKFLVIDDTYYTIKEVQ